MNKKELNEKTAPGKSGKKQLLVTWIENNISLFCCCILGNEGPTVYEVQEGEVEGKGKGGLHDQSLRSVTHYLTVFLKAVADMSLNRNLFFEKKKWEE